MMKILVFTKKEFIENIRSYKILMTLVVFMLFGCINPITAKLTPQILAEFMPPGMVVSVGDPTAIDAWVQFFKNMPMQLILILILFSSIIATEYQKGTLINVFTKGLRRRYVILSKYLFLCTMWTIGYVLCFLITYGYTIYLFPDDVPNLVFAAFCMWLFGIFLLAIFLLGNVIISQMYGGLLFSGISYVVGMTLGLFPDITKYNPLRLAAENLGIIQQKTQLNDYTPVILIVTICVIGLVTLSCMIFDRKEI